MNIGDYVRTRWGCIAKFEGIHEKFYEFDNIIMDESSAVREELFVDIVEKSSPNIIDLIEVDDYVNGERVIGFGKFIYDDGTEEITSLTLDTTVSCLPEDIKSIITKEQIEQMEYKL